MAKKKIVMEPFVCRGLEFSIIAPPEYTAIFLKIGGVTFNRLDVVELRDYCQKFLEYCNQERAEAQSREIQERQNELTRLQAEAGKRGK